MASLNLSVLDQSPIHDDKQPKEGLFDSIKLAKICEVKVEDIFQYEEDES